MISRMKAKLGETEEENRHLHETLKSLQEQVEAVNEEKSRMNFTVDIQDEEIKRLLSTEGGDQLNTFTQSI